MTENLIDERLLIESWIHQWGGAASEFVLEPSTLIFRTSHIDGFVVYQIESECAIAFGDPVCEMQNMRQLAQAFHDYCQERNMKVIHIITSEQFAKWAIKNVCSILIEVGEELVFNPQNDPTKGHRSYKLRNYIHHAQNLGLTVHEYLTNDVNLENSIDQVGVAWLKGRRGPQIYLGNLHFFEHRKNKRWFYVQDHEKIIAMALLSELKNQNWLLKYVISIPESPRGTTELLVNSIFQKLRSENCSFLTYGMVPTERLGEIVGLGRFSSWIARVVFKIIKKVFQLDSRKTYWQKFHPKTEPSYVLFSHSKIGLKEIRAMTKALNTKF
jgi:lysylphosphatidylglycerol synthetase-like protein (DUF2156 family)